MLQSKTAEIVYIRQSNGLAYQYPYSATETIREILASLLKTDSMLKMKAISNGRSLDLDKNLQQNGIKPNQIIHLITLARQYEEKGYVYLSFEDKIYRILFHTPETVKQFKQRVQRQTGLESRSQLILFNSIQLENHQSMKDFDIRSGDFLCMTRILQNKSYVLDLPQVIFPKRSSAEKRRGSECVPKNQNINLLEIKQEVTTPSGLKLFSSSCNKNLLASNYGPSPLSQYDSASFKACMDQWIKIQPETIIEHEVHWIEGQQNFEKSLSIKESQEDQYMNQLEGPRVKAMTNFTNGLPLCQSRNSMPSQFNKDIIIPKRLYQSVVAESEDNSTKFNSLIVPKFIVSINMTDPSISQDSRSGQQK